MLLSDEIAQKYQISKNILSDVGHLDNLDFKQLSALKTQIDRELNQHLNNLNSITSNNSSIIDNLVIDGFPRNDVDVLSITVLKRNIIYLQNDLKKVIDTLYTYLNNNSQLASTTEREIINYHAHNTFITFSDIAHDSPASMAGLQENDKLIRLNQLTSQNYHSLMDIQGIILQNEDKQINLTVKRSINENEFEILELILIPTKNWHSNGLLGCKITENK